MGPIYILIFVAALALTAGVLWKVTHAKNGGKHSTGDHP